MHSTFGLEDQEKAASGKVTSLQWTFLTRSLVLGRHGSTHISRGLENGFSFEPLKMKRPGRASDRADSASHAAILVHLGGVGTRRKG